MPRVSFLSALALVAVMSGALATGCAGCAGGAGGSGGAAPTQAPTTGPGSAAGSVEPSKPPPAQLPLAPMTLAQSGIVPDWIDRRADPCNDFFAYACGGFLKTAVIPDDRASWGSIQIVVEESERFLREVLENAAQTADGDPGLSAIGDYYAACMDEPAIERAGLEPVRPLLDTIAKVRDRRGAATVITQLHERGIYPFFSVSATQDYGDATTVIASLDQAGLGLPDRDYYLKSDGNRQQVRASYTAHLARMFELLGALPSAAKASTANVLRIETALARLQQDQVVRRDPHAIYHRVERKGLERAAPGFPWSTYLTGIGIPHVTTITVHDPAYYRAIANLLTTEKPAALRDYLSSQVIHVLAPTLGKAFVDEDFTLAQALTGIKSLPPRWRRCVQQVDRDLGDLLGQAYVAARFAGDAKARAVDLTQAVLAAMTVELDGLPWMDDATRAAAKRKLAKMAYLVGYPDTWRRYDAPIRRGDHAGNVLAATRAENARQLAKIGKPVDRFDWKMTPPTVNAYYDPTLNEIALPAGQLQPPFFGVAFHPAVNFGSTGGGTIGHEMTHGFDDEGSQFDADGNLRDWWSPSTKQQFKAATQCVIQQYARYEAIPGVHLNGELTAGENIADIGGVKLGFAAYQRWRAAQAHKPPAQVEGFTDDQLYFLAYGQSWCQKDTPENLETRAHSNPHSSAQWRVNGVVVDQPGFAAAFACKPSTPMNPGNPCAVW